MISLLRVVFFSLAALAAGAVRAAAVAPAPVPLPARAQTPVQTSVQTPVQTSAQTPEPAVQHLVSEDDNVRIEELRVRGQTQSITVKSKIPGVAAYQIVPSSGARDPSAPGNTAGQRLWHFFSF